MKKRRIVLLVVLVMLAFGAAFPFCRAAYQMKHYLKVEGVTCSPPFCKGGGGFPLSPLLR